MSQATQSSTAVGAGVIEWAPFRTRDGVSEAQLLEAADALQREFLVAQRGFVRRELLRASDGSWVDLVYWTDADAAHAIMDAIATSAACQRYFALMQGADTADPAAGVSHFTVVKPYGH